MTQTGDRHHAYVVTTNTTTEHTATDGNQTTRENVMKQAASAVVAGAFCCRLCGKNATKPALRKKSLS